MKTIVCSELGQVPIYSYLYHMQFNCIHLHVSITCMHACNGPIAHSLMLEPHLHTWEDSSRLTLVRVNVKALYFQEQTWLQ